MAEASGLIRRMAALGQSRLCISAARTSALHPEAAVSGAASHFAFLLTADAFLHLHFTVLKFPSRGAENKFSGEVGWSFRANSGSHNTCSQRGFSCRDPMEIKETFTFTLWLRSAVLPVSPGSQGLLLLDTAFRYVAL